MLAIDIYFVSPILYYFKCTTILQALDLAFAVPLILKSLPENRTGHVALLFILILGCFLHLNRKCSSRCRKNIDDGQANLLCLDFSHIVVLLRFDPCCWLVGQPLLSFNKEIREEATNGRLYYFSSFYRGGRAKERSAKCSLTHEY